uniref:Uncharacterized protein n=1 Tax=Ditylenchus dipsaci TaxID=166011 RepID=A0A915EJ60_9BILA
MVTYPANRVVQLDARSLDDCLLENFQAQLDQIASALFSSIRWQIAYNESRKILLPILYYVPQIFTGQINYSGLNRELIGHSLGHLYLLTTPLIKLCKTYVLPVILPRYSLKREGIGGDPENMVMCEECNQVAILPVKQAQETVNRRQSIYCYYCFYLTHNCDEDVMFLAKNRLKNTYRKEVKKLTAVSITKLKDSKNDCNFCITYG